MKYFFICLLAIILSCAGGNTQEQEEPVSDEKKTSSTEKSCLSEITNPGKWYSKNAASALINEPESNIEEKVNERFHQVQYRWQNDRKHVLKILENEMEVKTNNYISITIKNLEEAIKKAEKMHRGRKTFTYAQYFDSYHGQITKEDEKIIDEQIDKKGKEDENFDAKTAKKILDMATTQDYADISDLGDDANKYVQLAPGLRETRLAVLHGNVVVMLNVDVSDDDEVDLDIARKVAKAVIKLCD